uniref:EF-hand domain-containing protein n=1 Tax=Panagrellus redivivus TaxID=6233 RepID=A0A7E4V8W1_PANRE
MVKLILTGLALVAVASALEAKYDSSNDFDKVDGNSDGFISLPEFLKWHRTADQQKSIRLFKSYDTNADAHLSVPEFVPLVYALSRNPASEGEKLFKRLDSNNDGILTLHEARTNQDGIPEEITTGLFQVADHDQDGRISLHEFLHVVESVESVSAPQDVGTAQSLIVAIDVNGDKRVDKNELTYFANKFNRVSGVEINNVFKVLDINQDGFLDITELKRLPHKITELAGIRPMPVISSN